MTTNIIFASAKCIIRTICVDCGEKISEEGGVDKGYGEKSEHYFDMEYDQNLCLQCEYVGDNTPCAHSNMAVETRFRKKGSVTYYQIDENSHMVLCFAYDGGYCQDCKEYSSYVSDYYLLSTEEDHSFVDSVCEHCKYIEVVMTPESTAEPTETSSNRTEMDATGWITGDVVNVRAGESTDFDKLGRVYFADELHITASVENAKGEVWYEFDYESAAGYVRSDLVTFDGKLAAPTAVPTTVPTAEPTAEPTTEPTVEPTAEPAVEILTSPS